MKADRMTGRWRLLALAPLLWGADWHSAMGRELKVHRRTLGRYASGARAIQETLLRELEATAAQRIRDLAGALGATAAVLMPDGSVISSAVLPADLEARLRSVLEEVKAHCDANQETADAAE